MATLEDAATATLAQLGMDANLTLATSWARDKYLELLTTCKLNQSRRLATLTMPANITAGTVSITQGTRTITGDATAGTAWAAIDVTFEGVWYIRIDTIWYRVIAQDNTALTLTIDADYTPSTASSATYVLRKREFDLPESVKRLGLFYHQRWHQPTYPKPLNTLLETDPSRVVIDGGPELILDLGAAPNGRKRIEIYPGSSTAETLDYVYWTWPTDLTGQEPLPASIEAAQLAEGVKVHAYEWLGNQLMQKGQYDGAQVYFNLRDRQTTKWGHYMRELIRQDGAMDDVTFVTQKAKRAQHRDISTAEDYVWNKSLT